MSWRASSWAVKQRAGSPTAKAILLVLAEASSDEGFTFIGHAEIAARTELGKRTVIAILLTGHGPQTPCFSPLALVQMLHLGRLSKVQQMHLGHRPRCNWMTA
jgi:hypothetical protein